MRLLVTGASGYLGRQLVSKLTDHSIICPCIPGTEKMLALLENVTTVSTDDSQLLETVSDFNVEAVINVAGVYDTQPFSAVLSGNLVFPLTLLDHLASSVQRWVNVNTSLPRILSSYSLSKQQLGEWGQYYSEKYDLTFVDIQLEQFYGPFDGRFLSFVVGKLLANDSLELTECLQRRDVIHVEDVCSGIICLLGAQINGYHRIPLGSGKAPQLREIIEYCKSSIRSGSSIQFGAIPVRPGEPMLSVADTSQMEALGFSPKWSWQNGMQNMIEEMKKGK